MAARDPQAQMRRFLILFPICLVAGFGLLEVRPVAAAIAAFTKSLVTLSGGIIHFFGGKATVIGDILMSPVTGSAVKVENGCNAINVTILLWAAILTYPAPWVQKLKGLALGSLALHAVNLIRIITLYYLGQYDRNWFDFAHYYLWESLIVLDTLVIFWFWATLVRRAGRRLHATAA